MLEHGMPFGFGRKKDRAAQPSPGGDDHAPGWDALDARLSAAFGSHEPHHWATDSLLPAQDGPSGISAYRDGDAWFYVTYGLSDLYDLFGTPTDADASDGVRWSGFGFELTMRVLSNDASPPEWPIELLNKLGRYIYQSKAGFEHGHRLDPGGPITGGHRNTRLTALAFADDPFFEPIETPLGRVDFITVVGITADELARMKASTSEAVLSELRHVSPHLVTDPSR